MTDLTPEYESLTSRLAAAGLDVARIERELASFAVETPSWGYGDSGTRFGTFPQRDGPAMCSSGSTTRPRCTG